MGNPVDYCAKDTFEDFFPLCQIVKLSYKIEMILARKIYRPWQRCKNTSQNKASGAVRDRMILSTRSK